MGVEILSKDGQVIGYKACLCKVSFEGGAPVNVNEVERKRLADAAKKDKAVVADKGRGEEAKAKDAKKRAEAKKESAVKTEEGVKELAELRKKEDARIAKQKQPGPISKRGSNYAGTSSTDNTTAPFAR